MAFCLSASASSFAGRGAKLAVAAPTRRAGRAAVRRSASAKYGDPSVYFDLSDVEATTGALDGNGRRARTQEEFLEAATAGLVGGLLSPTTSTWPR